MESWLWKIMVADGFFVLFAEVQVVRAAMMGYYWWLSIDDLVSHTEDDEQNKQQRWCGSGVLCYA